MSGLVRVLRSQVVSVERAYSVGGVLLATFLFLFCLVGFRRIGELATGEAQFFLGLGIMLAVVMSVVACGLLLCVLQRLDRRSRS